MRYIQRNRPRLSILENVKGLTQAQHKKAFNGVLGAFDRLGYETYFKTLDTRDFAIPHSRERLYLVAIRRDSMKRPFKWPEEKMLAKPLSDFLDDFNSNADKPGRLPVKATQKALAMQAYNDAYLSGHDPRTFPLAVDIDCSMKFATVGYNEIKCLTRTRGGQGGPWISSRGRRTTLAELFRLQGFNPDDFKLIDRASVSASQMGCMLGNTMSLPVLKAVLIQGLWAAGLITRKPTTFKLFGKS